jgi:peptide/nickel transport system substrate-binding protein
MKKFTIKLALTLVLSVFVIASYGAESGGTLVIGQIDTPKILYGGVQSGIAVAVPSTQLFASPVRYTDNFEPKPYLAKSWKMADDDKTLPDYVQATAMIRGFLV